MKPPRSLCLLARLAERLGLDCMARRLRTPRACPLYILSRLGASPRALQRLWWLCGRRVRALCRPGRN